MESSTPEGGDEDEQEVEKRRRDRRWFIAQILLSLVGTLATVASLVVQLIS